MFVNEIGHLREYCQRLDEKTCKKYRVEQFGNMLCIIMDKGMLDDTVKSEKVIAEVHETFALLSKLIEEEEGNKATSRLYTKRYMELLETVRRTYGLEPVGAVQGRWVAIGIAMGSGIGAAMMSITNPAMLSIGICIGLALGVGIGQNKEREARDQGKLF